MKTRIQIVTGVILMCITITVIAQTVDSHYEVAEWKGFREGAVTYTFDDNTAKQSTIAIPMLREFNFAATFYPVINWSPNWDSLQSAVDFGCEVGSHTVTHTDLSTLNNTDQENELSTSQNTINSNITGQQCITIAYPYCTPGEQSICESYFIAARHCQGFVESTTPGNLYQISSIICGTEGTVQSPEDFQLRIEQAASSSGWCVFLIHGLDNDGGWSSLSSDSLRESLEYLDANRNRIWVETFKNVVRYIKERDDVSVTELTTEENTITVEVTDNLPDNIYNVPVTLRRIKPENWPYVAVTQNGAPVVAKAVNISSEDYIEFDVIPDGGDIVLTRSETVVDDIDKIQKNSFVEINRNLFTNTFRISTSKFSKYFIYSMEGKLLEYGTVSGTINAGSNLSSGIYVLNVKNDTEFYTTKIFKK